MDFNTLRDSSVIDVLISKGNQPSDYHAPEVATATSEIWYIVETFGTEERRMVQIAHLPYKQYRESFLRYRHDSSWSPWVRIAAAAPPQVYDLPLAEGLSTLYGCTYRKDQFGNIVVRMAAQMTADRTGFATIATLPEGYVPAKNTEIPITLKAEGNTYSASSAKIEGGAIRAYFPSAATYSIYINCIL